MPTHVAVGNAGNVRFYAGPKGTMDRKGENTMRPVKLGKFILEILAKFISLSLNDEWCVRF